MNGIQGFALIVLSFHLILLGPILPSWLLMASALLIVWKAWVLRSGHGQAPRILVMAITALLLSLMLLENAALMSRESMISIVCISSLMCCMDKASHHQVMLAHGSFFGLLVGLLVMRGTPLPLPLFFFLTILIFFSLLLHHLPATAIFSLWPLGRNILKIAVPVSAVLLPIYFFFPEIRPPQAESAVTGVSDLLEPGAIARLALSDKLAFRARFHSELPQDQALYWRVAVMEESYGMIWRKRRDSVEEKIPPRAMISASIIYDLIPLTRLGSSLPLLEHTITIEGMGQHPSQIWWQSDQKVFRSQNEIFAVTAAGHDHFVPKDPPPKPDLQIEVSDRVQGLVEQLKKLSDEQRSEYLLAMLSHFTYTLEPGSLKRESALDEFLFEKQRGFCEHFAAAFASLLQLAGTPARVVTGYKGGVFAGTSDFMIIRDSDAHAWTEVYLHQRWQRIDPSRVAINGADPKAKRLWITALPAAWASYLLRLTAIKIREWTEATEYLWFFISGFLAILIALQIWRLQRLRLKTPAWQRQMDQFLLQCKRLGLERQSSEGMGTFVSRIKRQFPDLQSELDELSATYQNVVYGPLHHSEEALLLEQRFRSIRSDLRELRTPHQG